MELVLENGDSLGLPFQHVVLLGLHDLELLLSNPVGLGGILVHDSLSLLVEVADVKPLSGIVLFESKSLGLWLLFGLLLTLAIFVHSAQDLVLVQLVLHGSDPASSASTLSWLGAKSPKILHSSGPTLPIMGSVVSNFLNGLLFSVTLVILCVFSLVDDEVVVNVGSVAPGLGLGPWLLNSWLLLGSV